MAGGLTFHDRLKVWRATGCKVALSPEAIDQLICLMDEHQRKCGEVLDRSQARVRTARIYLALGLAAFVGSALVAIAGGWL